MSHFDDWVTDPSVTKARIEAFLADSGNSGREFLDRYVVCTTSGATGIPAILLHDHAALVVYNVLGYARSLSVFWHSPGLGVGAGTRAWPTCRGFRLRRALSRQHDDGSSHPEDAVARGNAAYLLRRPVPAGRLSDDVLITYLANRIQPIIRYRMGDRVAMDADPCICGSPFPSIQSSVAPTTS